MSRHTEHCRERHTDPSRTVGMSETELLHEILERLDRLTGAIETVVETAGPLLRGRLAKMASGRAVAKVQAEWKDGA